MINTYPDCSFLFALYRPQFNSAQAAAYFQQLKEPLHVTSLLLYEFRQAVRLHIWLNSKDSTKGFSAADGELVLATLQSDLSNGVIKLISANWTEVLAIAERLSATHTLSHGFRAFDTLHVATAIHLGVKEFASCDQAQRTLAALENLTVKP